MTRTRSICRGCHHFRVVNEVRYCTGCESKLRADEKRRPVVPENTLPSLAALDPIQPASIQVNVSSDDPIVGLCLHCQANGIWASLQSITTARGEVERCWQCGGEYRDGVLVHPLPDEVPTTPEGHPLPSVPPEEGETDAGEERIQGEIGETILAEGRHSAEPYTVLLDSRQFDETKNLGPIVSTAVALLAALPAPDEVETWASELADDLVDAGDIESAADTTSESIHELNEFLAEAAPKQGLVMPAIPNSKDHRCGACSAENHVDCSGWCFCDCEYNA